MFDALIIFTLQLVFQYARVHSTKGVIKDSIPYVLISTGVIQMLYLTTTYYGVKAIMDKDITTLAGFMFGGLLGVYLAMKLDKKGET